MDVASWFSKGTDETSPKIRTPECRVPLSHSWRLQGRRRKSTGSGRLDAASTTVDTSNDKTSQEATTCRKHEPCRTHAT